MLRSPYSILDSSDLNIAPLVFRYWICSNSLLIPSIVSSVSADPESACSFGYLQIALYVRFLTLCILANVSKKKRMGHNITKISGVLWQWRFCT